MENKIKELENEIESLKEERGDLLLQVNAYNTLMPCAHLARYAVTFDDGTSFCLACEYQEKIKQISRLQAITGEQ